MRATALLPGVRTVTVTAALMVTSSFAVGTCAGDQFEAVFQRPFPPTQLIGTAHAGTDTSRARSSTRGARTEPYVATR